MVLSAEPGPKQRKASTVDKAAKRLQLVGPTREWPEPSTADLTRRDTPPSSSAPERRHHAGLIGPRPATICHRPTDNAHGRTREVFLPGHTQRRPSVPRRKLPLKACSGEWFTAPSTRQLETRGATEANILAHDAGDAGDARGARLRRRGCRYGRRTRGQVTQPARRRRVASLDSWVGFSTSGNPDYRSVERMIKNGQDQGHARGGRGRIGL